MNLPFPKWKTFSSGWMQRATFTLSSSSCVRDSWNSPSQKLSLHNAWSPFEWWIDYFFKKSFKEGDNIIGTFNASFPTDQRSSPVPLGFLPLSRHSSHTLSNSCSWWLRVQGHLITRLVTCLRDPFCWQRKGEGLSGLWWVCDWASCLTRLWPLRCGVCQRNQSQK